MTKKCLFVSCRGRRILSVFLLTPIYFLFFLIILFVFPYLISHFYFVISHYIIIGCNVLKMKSYENLMQNIRLLQKEVLLLHLI